MSAPTVESTMPASATADVLTARPTPLHGFEPTDTPSTTARTSEATMPSPARSEVAHDLSAAELEARLIAAHQRTAELEQQLAAADRARDAAEHQVAQLEDRNRELASDVDNALDQLDGHALHAEQERLVRAPMWSPWDSSSTDREEFSR
ncbi:hypothetical protein ACFQZZ_14550 [Nocardia sp. GCM10030253]|uniref:hypothetical protein n=1 Tax=Nocardia sp. GCM10030253 TaxID=3273404 RepID=UPI00363BBBB2